MKSRLLSTSRLPVAGKVKSLELKIATAEETAAKSHRHVRTAKAAFKRARKALKQAKKAAKAARRSLKALQRELDQTKREAGKSLTVARKKTRVRKVGAAKPAPRRVAERSTKPAPQPRSKKPRSRARRPGPVEALTGSGVVDVPAPAAAATSVLGSGDLRDPLPSERADQPLPSQEPPAGAGSASARVDDDGNGDDRRE